MGNADSPDVRVNYAHAQGRGHAVVIEGKLSRRVEYGDLKQSAQIQRENRFTQPEASGRNSGIRRGDERPEYYQGSKGKGA